MSIPGALALEARELYVAAALSVLVFLIWMLRTGAKRTPSADPSRRQSKRSKAISKDEEISQQPAQSSAIDPPQNEPRCRAVTTQTPQNDPRRRTVTTQGSNDESRTAQLHEGSSSVSAIKRQPSVCLRISNVRPTWSEAELLQAFQSSDDSLDFATGQYRLSLYPACCGSSQTALLNFQCPGHAWDLESNKDKLIGRGDSDLVMDRHFYGLTPLNNPGDEIIAE